MNVIVLAAGTGSRLGDKTPRPAQAGRARRRARAARLHGSFARRAGGDQVGVVIGYRSDVSEPLAQELGVDTSCWNPAFADAGNLVSLGVAKAAGLCDGGFLLMNSDHIYKPSIADTVKAAAARPRVTAFIDPDRRLGPDDMKVRLDGEGRITAIDKQLETLGCRLRRDDVGPAARDDGLLPTRRQRPPGERRRHPRRTGAGADGAASRRR